MSFHNTNGKHCQDPFIQQGLQYNDILSFLPYLLASPHQLFDYPEEKENKHMICPSYLLIFLKKIELVHSNFLLKSL